MRQVSLALSVSLAGSPLTGLSCDSDKPGSLAAKTGTVVSAPMPQEVLMSVVGLSLQANNDARVSQYKHSYIAVVANWFQVALKVDLTLAEAHYNLGLRLDEMG